MSDVINLGGGWWRVKHPCGCLDEVLGHREAKALARQSCPTHTHADRLSQPTESPCPAS